MLSNDFLENERLLGLLQEELLAKIDHEWEEKYAHLGKDRLTALRTAQFAVAVRADMEQNTKADGGADQLIVDAKVLHNYLMDQEWPVKINTRCIGQLLAYLGYQNWQDFTDQHPDAGGKRTGGSNDRDGSSWWSWGPVILLVLSFGLDALYGAYDFQFSQSSIVPGQLEELPVDDRNDQLSNEPMMLPE